MHTRWHKFLTTPAVAVAVLSVGAPAHLATSAAARPGTAATGLIRPNSTHWDNGTNWDEGTHWDNGTNWDD